MTVLPDFRSSLIVVKVFLMKAIMARLVPAPEILLSWLLKNTHLLRCAHPSSLRRTVKYASFLVISRALQLNVFDQPVKNHLFNNLLVKFRQGRIF